jgi:hypothetical protein
MGDLLCVFCGEELHAISGPISNRRPARRLRGKLDAVVDLRQGQFDAQ